MKRKTKTRNCGGASDSKTPYGATPSRTPRLLQMMKTPMPTKRNWIDRLPNKPRSRSVKRRKQARAPKVAKVAAKNGEKILLLELDCLFICALCSRDSKQK